MQPREEQSAVKLILRDLADGPATVRELENEIGITRRNLRPYLALLHAQKLIHIGGWEVRTGPALPVWHFGEGDDRLRPRRKYKRYGCAKSSPSNSSAD